jgi:hypothetical protein
MDSDGPVLSVTTPPTNRPTPASSGTIRQADGAGGVTRRLTPSGDTRIRRNDQSAAATATTGTPTPTTA